MNESAAQPHVVDAGRLELPGADEDRRAPHWTGPDALMNGGAEGDPAETVLVSKTGKLLLVLASKMRQDRNGSWLDDRDDRESPLAQQRDGRGLARSVLLEGTR